MPILLTTARPPFTEYPSILNSIYNRSKSQSKIAQLAPLRMSLVIYWLVQNFL